MRKDIVFLDAILGACENAKPFPAGCHMITGVVVGTLIEESGQPAIVSLRLKVDHSKVSEAEAVIARKGGSMFAPEGFIANPPPDKPLPKELRSSREQMIAAADSYFNGAQSQNPSIVLQKRETGGIGRRSC